MVATPLPCLFPGTLVLARNTETAGRSLDELLQNPLEHCTDRRHPGSAPPSSPRPRHGPFAGALPRGSSPGNAAHVRPWRGRRAGRGGAGARGRPVSAGTAPGSFLPPAGQHRGLSGPPGRRQVHHGTARVPRPSADGPADPRGGSGFPHRAAGQAPPPSRRSSTRRCDP